MRNLLLPPPTAAPSALHASSPPLTHRRTWLVLSVLALAGCAAAPPAVRRSERSAEAVAQGNDIALFALSLLDVRYSYGGRGPATGFDCSGLVSHVYRQAAGIDLRGSAASMAKQARPVERTDWLPGDLLFFNTLGAPYSHVGIHVGNGRFVHAANERSGVRVDSMQQRYYASRFEGAKTLLG